MISFSWNNKSEKILFHSSKKKQNKRHCQGCLLAFGYVSDSAKLFDFVRSLIVWYRLFSFLHLIEWVICEYFMVFATDFFPTNMLNWGNNFVEYFFSDICYFESIKKSIFVESAWIWNIGSDQLFKFSMLLSHVCKWKDK